MTKRIRIVRDENAENPRTAWDNVGTMACWHGRYKLGDIRPKESPEDFVKELPEGTVILPLYLYAHGGITMKTSPFSCPWDSGQVGIIYVTQEKLKHELGESKDEPMEDRAKRVLESEVETYDQYLRGEVFGYIIEETETCSLGHEHVKEVESCWGFYGSNIEENGILDNVPDYMIEAAKKAAKSLV